MQQSMAMLGKLKRLGFSSRAIVKATGFSQATVSRAASLAGAVYAGEGKNEPIIRYFEGEEKNVTKYIESRGMKLAAEGKKTTQGKLQFDKGTGELKCPSPPPKNKDVLLCVVYTLKEGATAEQAVALVEALTKVSMHESVESFTF